MPIQFQKTQQAIIEKYGGIVKEEYIKKGSNHYHLRHPSNDKMLMVKHGKLNNNNQLKNFEQSVKWWCDDNHPYGKTGAMKALDHEQPQAVGGKVKLSKREKKILRLGKNNRK